MLEVVLCLWGIGKQHETAGGVLTGLFGPTDATISQHGQSTPVKKTESTITIKPKRRHTHPLQDRDEVPSPNSNTSDTLLHDIAPIDHQRMPSHIRSSFGAEPDDGLGNVF